MNHSDGWPVSADRDANGRKFRVVHLSPGIDVGGMEKLLVEFARHADRDRFDLRFVVLGGRGRLAADVEECGWPVTTLDIPPGLRFGLPARLAGMLRRWGADFVHTHNTKALIYGAPAARLAGVRGIFHTRHGQRFGASRNDNLLFLLTAKMADKIVCVSHDSARLSMSEGLSAGKLVTIWNGIDVTRFAFIGPERDGPVVMVGRLSPEKDAATLVRAAALVAREHPGFRLEVAGDGRCLPELQALSTELGLDGVVTFLGAVRDIPALLRRCSLFALHSLTEGVSMTLLEAMSVGLPVVTTRVGGSPEVVVDGETGLLIAPGNAEELAGAILQVLRDPERGEQMGRAGRDRVERFFDVRRMVATYEALYLDRRGIAQRRRVFGAKDPRPV